MRKAVSVVSNFTNLSRLAGSDTTAISLRALFYYVIKSPSVYVKLQKEVDEADRDGKLSHFVTYAESLELKYLYVKFVLTSIQPSPY